MSKYVIIGASVAGISAIRVLRQQDKTSEIILISEETQIYSKCSLHYFAAGERSEEMLSFITPDFMNTYNIIWKQGKTVVGIAPNKKEVILSDGSAVDFDKLLIATGSHASVPPIKGLKGAKNAFTFHSLDDCKKVMAIMEKSQNVVILGAGLVGVDAAYALSLQKKTVSMIEIKEHMLALQLDVKAAKVYQDEFTKRGVAQYYSMGISAVIQNADDNIEQLLLTDGSKLPCDLLIFATGAKANVDWLKDSGIITDDNGLVIDEYCKTNYDDIYGAGDVTGKDLVWPVAAKEARTAAFNMTGKEYKMTNFFEKKATINLFFIPTMTFGMPDAPDDTYNVEVKEGKDNSYQKLIYKEGKIYGAILQKEMYYTGILNQLKYKNIDMSKIHKPLFEFDYADLLIT